MLKVVERGIKKTEVRPIRDAGPSCDARLPMPEQLSTQGVPETRPLGDNRSAHAVQVLG